MKKVYLGLLLLGATSMLAACGGSNGESYVIKEGKTVLTEQFINANSKVNREYKANYTLQTKEIKTPEGYTATSIYNYASGYQVYEKDGKYGVYSLFADKFIIDARLTSITASQFTEDATFGFDVIYQEPSNEHWYIADGVGNVVAESKTGFALMYSSTYFTKQYNVVTDQKGNQTLYSSWSYQDTDPEVESSYVNKCFKYDANNVAKAITFAEYTRRTEKAGDYPENAYEFDFSEEGLDLSVLVFGDAGKGYTFKVNDKAGEEKATFLLASANAESRYFVAGKRIYTQRVNQLDGKYVVDSKYIDLEALKEKSYNSSLMFRSITALQSVENDEHQYFAASIQEINNDGTLGAKRVMIIDEEGDFHDDITYKNFVEWTKLSNGYYLNRSDYELYDNEFKFVASVSGYSFSSDSETFTRYSSSSEGAIILNNEGKFIADVAKEYKFNNINARFNKVYQLTDLATSETAFFDANTSKVYKLENTKAAEESKVAVEETNVSTYFIRRVEKTYPDVERSQPEEEAKRKGSLRTLDGQQIFSVESGYVNSSISSIFTQTIGRKVELACVVSVNATVNSVVKTTKTLVYTNLFSAQSIEAPAAPAAA